MSRIYVASSWRNPHQQQVVRALREVGGHEVYDFRHPFNGVPGFSWSEIDPNWQVWSAAEYRELLTTHPIAARGFVSDLRGMQWADTCVLVLPCGRSAHLEAGWFCGQGKRCIILTGDGEEPELMALLATDICISLGEVINALKAEGPAADGSLAEQDRRLARWRQDRIHDIAENVNQQSPAGETIRSAQGDAMETAPATGQPPVGAVSPSLPDPFERACRVCGCTEISACVDPRGEPCCWMDEDLCSVCHDAEIEATERDAARYRHLRKRWNVRAAFAACAVFGENVPARILDAEGLDRALDAEMGTAVPDTPTLEARLAECLAAIIDTPVMKGADSILSAPLEIRVGFFLPELSARAAELLEEAGR